MRKTLLIFAIIINMAKVANAQCNFYMNLYSITDLDRIQNLLPASTNQFYASMFYYPGWRSAICKLDSLGDTLWTKEYCGFIFNDLQYNLDSNLVAVNEYYVTCGPTIGQSDIVFSKFDLNGDTLFTSRFGTTGNDNEPSLAILNDSTYVVTFNNSVGQNNIYHLDAIGQIIGTGVMPFEYVKDVVQGKDGNLYYCGFSCYGCPNSFAVGKTNAALDTIFWIRGFETNGGFQEDWFNSLQILPDSNLMTTGINCTYKINYLTGDSIWKNNLDGVGMTLLKDSSVYIYGYVHIYKTNTYGDSLWGKYLSFNPNQWMEFNSVIKLDQGCFAVLGSRVTSSTTTYEPFFAYFDSLFDFPINVGFDEQQAPLNATVYPIPFTDELNVKVANEIGINAVTITTVTGQVVKQLKPANNAATVSITDLGGLTSGIYFLKLDAADKTTFLKIVKL